MSIKDDELYSIYVSYLENRRLSQGAMKLAQMSEDMFYEFVKRYENEPHFREKQDNLYKIIKRDITIEEILEEKDDFELFLDDLENTKVTKEDDDFFDF